MAVEKGQFEFATPKAPEVKAAPEQKENSAAAKEKTDNSPEGVGKTVEQEFKTPEQQNVVAKEFENSFSDKISQFSKDFQKAFCDANGKIDLSKILALFGLDKLLGSQIDSSTGKVKPPEQVATAPAGQPTATDATFEFGTASGGKLPPRPSDAPTGSEFMARNNFGNMNLKANQYKMEQAILAEIERGNVPSFCRPEKMKTLAMQKNGITVNYKAGLDYLAVGSDDNYVRVPMTPLLAQTLAKRYGWGLPTGAMTDNIYSNADIKLEGKGYITAPPGTAENRRQQSMMQGNEFIERHTHDVDSQLGPDGKQRLLNGQALVAGHKKDVIISRYAVDHPGSLDFRGLYINGRPIQTNPAHEDTYRDYSHGFRPIDGNIVVAYPDGRTETMKYYDALKDPQIAQVLNGADGAINAYQAYNKPIQSNSQPAQQPAKPNSDFAVS